MGNNISSFSSQGGHEQPALALVGCGAIAENYYLPALMSHPDILSRLIFVDSHKQRADELKRKYKAAGSANDYCDIITRVQGAIIAVPTHLHFQIARDFISAGKPVLCEKPLTDTFENAKVLVQLAEDNHVPLAVNYLQRLIPSFAKVKETISQRTLGEPLDIKYYIGEEFDWPTVSGFYFNAPLSSRGILRDRGAHALDHICWWLDGKPRLLQSENDAFNGSEATAHITFEKGRCKGELKLSWMASFPCTYRVAFENGVLSGNIYDYQNLYQEKNLGHKNKIHLNSTEKTKPDIARKIVANFVDVLSGKEQPIITGEEVLDSIELNDECYASVTQFSMPWYDSLRN